MKKTKAQILAFFSEKGKVSKDTAQSITDLLYEKGLDIKSLDRVMWRIEDYIRKEKMATIFDLLTPLEMGQVIDEMIAEDLAWKTRNMPSEDGTSLVATKANFTAWGFSEFAEGDKIDKKAGDIVDIQIMRVGKWNHPAYGEFAITKDTLKEVKANFDADTRGIELAVDENHEPNHKALACYKELYQVTENDLFAKLELTQKGADLLNEGAYRYFSPEIVFFKTDEETGKPITNMLVGGAFTNRPFFKSMQPLMASEDGQETEGSRQAQSEAGLGYSENFYIFFEPTMKTLLDLLAAFSELAKISKAQKDQLEGAFNDLPADSKSPEITKAVTQTLAKFSEDGEGQGAGEGAGAGAGNGEGEGAGTGTEGAGVAATEGVVSIQASELAALRAAAAKGQEAQKTTLAAFCETSVSAVIAKGSVLPKHKDKLAQFSESLGSVEKAKEFFELIGEFKAFNSTEVGSGADPKPAEASKDAKFSETVMFFQEKMGFSEDEAKKAAETSLKA
jgi:hypothetical protein